MEERETRQERRARERDKRKGRGDQKPQQTVAEYPQKRGSIPFVLSGLVGMIIALVGVKLFFSVPKQEIEIQEKQLPTKVSLRGKTYGNLLEATPEQVSSMDIAEINLICGSGLSGTENIDIGECMKRFDLMTERVRSETARNWGRWQKNPAEYENSLAHYKMGMLITVVRQDFETKYNAQLITDPANPVGNDVFYKDANNVFLQGLLTDKKMGTCASMPVLYVAIARRLGYPVYLVSTKGHLFCRWDDGKERMNFEGTGDGVRINTDEYYQKFPYPLTKWEKEGSTYLKNLSRSQELAIFLDARASCLVASKRNAEALIAEAQAIRLVNGEGLTGLIESMTFGRMIPNRVFQLAIQETNQKKKAPEFDVEAFNRVNQRNMNRHDSDPHAPNSGLPHFPNSPQSPQRGFPHTPAFPNHHPR